MIAPREKSTKEDPAAAYGDPPRVEGIQPQLLSDHCVEGALLVGHQALRHLLRFARWKALGFVNESKLFLLFVGDRMNLGRLCVDLTLVELPGALH